MGSETGIEWTDATWNPVTGCTKVSPGCDHCYAETFAERFRGVPGHHFERGFDVQLRPDKLDLPLRWRKPRRIFVNSMSDLFHDDIPDDYIARVFAIMAVARQHTFQVLTKRHGRMRSLLNSETFLQDLIQYVVDAEVHDGQHFDGDEYTLRALPNVWLGVSVENQQWADIRIPALLETPAAVRFLSCEPLLGPIDLDTQPWRPIGEDLAQIDWVIVGGESGRSARPMHPDWARSLRDQCMTAGVAFHFKQLGEWTPNWIYGDSCHIHTFDDGEQVLRVGKKAAGRELDGRTWDEFPQGAS